MSLFDKSDVPIDTDGDGWSWIVANAKDRQVIGALCDAGRQPGESHGDRSPRRRYMPYELDRSIAHSLACPALDRRHARHPVS